MKPNLSLQKSGTGYFVVGVTEDKDYDYRAAFTKDELIALRDILNKEFPVRKH